MGGGLLRGRLGAERNAKPCGLNHRNIIRAIAHGHGLASRHTQTFGPTFKRVQLHRFGDDIALHLARKPTIGNLQAVRQPIIDMRLCGQHIHDLMETARNHTDLPVVRMQFVDEFQRTASEMNTFSHGLEHRIRQPLKQSYAGAQRFAKIQLPAHRLLGNSRDLFTATGRLAQFVDDFLFDQCGIHIHHQQSRVGQCGQFRGIWGW